MKIPKDIPIELIKDTDIESYNVHQKRILLTLNFNHADLIGTGTLRAIKGKLFLNLTGRSGRADMVKMRLPKIIKNYDYGIRNGLITIYSTTLINNDIATKFEVK